MTCRNGGRGRLLTWHVKIKVKLTAVTWLQHAIRTWRWWTGHVQVYISGCHSTIRWHCLLR